MAQGDKHTAVDGTITLPLSVVKVNSGVAEKSTLRLQNTTGPGDGGNVDWTEGNYAYRFSVNGILVEGETPETTTNAAIRGSGTIGLGTGEQWSGTVIIQSIRASSDWGPGGSIGVQLSGVFTGAVTVEQPPSET